MKASVVTPNYNGEKFLKTFFESLNNDCECIGEVIIVDNGSTDGSLESQETEPRPEPVTLPVTFRIPEKEGSYLLSIQLDGREVVAAREIMPGTATCTVELTNYGTRSYDLFIDGEFYRSQKVTFTDD